MSKGWSIFLIAVWLLKLDAAEFSFSLDRETLDLGERATLLLSLKPEPGEEQYQPYLEDELFLQGQGYLVLERRAEKLGDRFEWHYEIASHTPGSLSLPPIQVRLGSGTYSTEKLTLQSKTTRQEGDDEIRPEFGGIKKPFHWSLALQIVAVLLAAAILGWIASILLKHVPLKKILNWRPHLPTPEENPRHFLKRELARLRMRLQTEGEESDILDDASRTFRVFFSKQSKKPYTAWTTREIENHLRSKELIPFFQRSDEMRFAGKLRTEGASIVQTVEEALGQAQALYL